MNREQMIATLILGGWEVWSKMLALRDEPPVVIRPTTNELVYVSQKRGTPVMKYPGGVFMNARIQKTWEDLSDAEVLEAFRAITECDHGS